MGEMKMTVIGGELTGGGRPSEDRIVGLRDAVIVLDGVSTLSTTTPLGGWYSDCLGLELATSLTTSEDSDLRDVLQRSIAAVTKRHGLVPGDSPAATVAMARLRDGQMESLVLADTPVVALLHDGSVNEVRDDRLADLITPQRKFREYQARLRAGDGFSSPDHRRLLQELRAIQMEHVNRDVPGAYWVAEAVPEAAQHAVVQSWPASDLDSLLVMTDGVSCAVEEYDLFPSWSAMARGCASEGPQSVVDVIHTHEETDPYGQRYPRYKIHDDKALVWAYLSPVADDY